MRDPLERSKSTGKLGGLVFLPDAPSVHVHAVRSALLPARHDHVVKLEGRAQERIGVQGHGLHGGTIETVESAGQRRDELHPLALVRNLQLAVGNKLECAASFIYMTR